MAWSLPYSSADNTVDNLKTAYNELAGVLNDYIDFYNDWRNYHLNRITVPGDYVTYVSQVSTLSAGDDVQDESIWRSLQQKTENYIGACGDHTKLVSSASYTYGANNYQFSPNVHSRTRTDANAIIDASSLSAADKAASKFTTSTLTVGTHHLWTSKHGPAGATTSYRYIQPGDILQGIHIVNQLWAVLEVCKTAGLITYRDQIPYTDYATSGYQQGNDEIFATTCADSLTNMQDDWANSPTTSTGGYNGNFRGEFLMVRTYDESGFGNWVFDWEAKEKGQWNLTDLPSGDGVSTKVMLHVQDRWVPQDVYPDPNNLQCDYLDMEGTGDSEDTLVAVAEDAAGTGAIVWTDTATISPQVSSTSSPEPSAHASVSCANIGSGNQWGQSWVPLVSCNLSASDP